MAATSGDLLGGIGVALASLQFGAVVLLGKIASNEGVPVTAALAVRFSVAAALLAGVAIASRQPVRPAKGERLPLAALGAAGYGIEATLFFLAVARGSPAAVTLLFFTYPVVVALISTALGAPLPGPLVLGSLAVAVGGAAMVVASSGSLDIGAAGVALALASGVVFAFYLVGAERVLRNTTALAGAAWVSGAAAIATAALSLAGGGARFPSGAGLVAVVGMGAFTAGAFVCLFVGLRRLGAVRTAIIAALEPVATAVLARAFLGDRLRPMALAGGAMILVASAAASVARGAGAEEIP